MNMNKKELIEHIATGADISTLTAEQVLNSFISHVIETVSAKDVLQLIGLGSFSQGERSARNGRNPVTGAVVHIAASRTIKFRPGIAFKNSLNHTEF